MSFFLVNGQTLNQWLDKANRVQKHAKKLKQVVNCGPKWYRVDRDRSKPGVWFDGDAAAGRWID